MAHLAIPLVVISRQDVSNMVHGSFDAPLAALCDIGKCLGGRERTAYLGFQNGALLRISHVAVFLIFTGNDVNIPIFAK